MQNLWIWRQKAAFVKIRRRECHFLNSRSWFAYYIYYETFMGATMTTKGSILWSIPTVNLLSVFRRKKIKSPFWAKFRRFWGINSGFNTNFKYYKPKKALCVISRVLSCHAYKSIKRSDHCRQIWEKRQKTVAYILPICPEASCGWICTRFGLEGPLAAGAVLGKNIWGPSPHKFSHPPLFPIPLPSLPSCPLNFLSHPCPSFPSLPFPFLPPSPFLFPNPFLSLPVPLSFPPFPPLRSRPP